MSTTTDQDMEERDVQQGETLVSVQDLKIYYGGDSLMAGEPVRAVDGVSFDIKRGETLGLVGESGCGKTTLGRGLIRLEEARDGIIEFKGTDITELQGSALKQWRREVQFVFQDPESSLNSRMTVGEIIKEPLDVHDWQTPRDRRARVRELLDIVGLHPEHFYRYPHQFSGGQKQRVGIARALALQPDFIILDEPVSALDASVQAKILNLLDDLQEEFGLTYLVIAHDLSMVEQITDRVAVMYLGNIMEIGETADLFEDPSNPYTLSLLSAIPEPDPTIEKRRITLRGTPPSPRDPPNGCPFSTRCPMKIRPDKYQNVDEEVWESVEIFREVLRERAGVTKSLTQKAKERLGMSTAGREMDEVLSDTFGGHEVPSEIETHVQQAVEFVRNGDAQRAVEYMNEEFGGLCDEEFPDEYPVGDKGRTSTCHRHAQGHDEPESFVTIYD